MKISILGLGWYGFPLARELKKSGWEVSGSTTTAEKKAAAEKEGIEANLVASPSVPESTLLASDVIVLNIPPFEGQLEWLKSWSWDFSKWLIFISSTSVVSGQSPILREEESWVQSNFFQPTIIRFGGLFGAGRHPGKFLSGRTNLKNKNWPVNLIHLDDTIGVTKTVLEKSIRGVSFEAVASEHPTREEYYTSWCQRAGLPLPSFDPQDESTRPPIDNTFLRTFYTPLGKL